jgi:DNA-binding response OmpR family regulator
MTAATAGWKIGLVEDDDRIRSSLHGALTNRGYQVFSDGTGLAGLRRIMEEKPNAVILDLGLPDIDGIELVKMIRAVSQVPIIAATARDDERVIVHTLNLGADDYVVKPFSADHLEARLQAVLRRAVPQRNERLEVGRLVIDTAARVAEFEGRPLELTRKEFDLLAYLAAEPGRVVPKRELLAAVWDQPYGGVEKTVDVHLSWLRRKLGETAAAPRYLQVSRGVGVKLVDPETE